MNLYCALNKPKQGKTQISHNFFKGSLYYLDTWVTLLLYYSTHLILTIFLNITIYSKTEG